MAKEVSEVNNPARLDSDSSVPINLTIVVVLFEFSAGARGIRADFIFPPTARENAYTFPRRRRALIVPLSISF